MYGIESPLPRSGVARQFYLAAVDSALYVAHGEVALVRAVDAASVLLQEQHMLALAAEELDGDCRAVSGRALARAVSFYSDLFIMVEPGGLWFAKTQPDVIARGVFTFGRRSW
jgi:hypothetical protein